MTNLISNGGFVSASLESSNDMGHKNHKSKHKLQPSVLTDLKEQRKKAPSLGYENVEDYQKGLSVISRLLANKDKGFWRGLWKTLWKSLAL